MNIIKAIGIDGWMNEAELTFLANSATNKSRIAEIGSWKGRSTCALAEHTHGQVYAIDTWAGSDEQLHRDMLLDKDINWLFETFKENIKGLPVTPYRMTSVDAASMFFMENIRFDMIFIDASHDYEGVKQDILIWRPLLSPGGLLCGHDYNNGWPGVIQAVTETIPNHHVIPNGSIWVAD